MKYQNLTFQEVKKRQECFAGRESCSGAETFPFAVC